MNTELHDGACSNSRGESYVVGQCLGRNETADDISIAANGSGDESSPTISAEAKKRSSWPNSSKSGARIESGNETRSDMRERRSGRTRS